MKKKAKNDNNYFFLTIGPVSRKRLDEGYPNGEGGIRQAAQDRFYQMFPDIKFTCASGWGMTEQMKDDARYATYSDEYKRLFIQSYHHEGKKVPRALRAWELLFNEEDNK